MTSLIARSGFFDDFFRDVSPALFVKPAATDAAPAPIRIDVRETPAGYVVDAEIPGVAREDIHVTIEGPVVTLQAEIKPLARTTEGERVLRSERFHGSVARTFQLPHEIDSGAARARYDNGVLQLTLPRKLAQAGQRLNIE
jgi:HSP20 family protein